MTPIQNDPPYTSLSIIFADFENINRLASHEYRFISHNVKPLTSAEEDWHMP